MRKTLISTLACLCLLLSFNSLNAQFETELRLIPTDCDYGITAFLAYAQNNYATYDWGDGTSESATWSYVNHTYEAPGVYQVIVINDGITYLEEVSVEDCTCPTEIESIEVYGQCSSVSVTIDTYLFSSNDYDVEWTWGDGTTSSSSWGYPSGYHSYSEEGDYEICGFFTGPGCEDGVLLCDSVTIQFCEEPCYYGDPIIEFNENTCSYDVGLIEAPSDVIWTVNGEYYETNAWPTSVELPAGDNLICMEILPNLDWNCPLGYYECFEVFVEEDQCAEPDFSYEETSCGLIEFDFDLNGLDIELQSVSFGNGVVQNLSNGENFEHYFGPLTNVYEVCILYTAGNSDVLSEFCYDIEVSGCPEEYCWLELWGQEVECGEVEFNAFTGLDFFQDYEVFWTFGDGFDEYGWSWTNHTYEEPGTYTACAEVFSPYCTEQVLVSCFTIEIEECEDDCTEPISAASLDCGFWEFSVGENWSVEFALWDFGDGTEAEVPFNDVLTVQHQYEESGVYEVCVSYYDLSCNGMTEECFSIEVEVCNDDVCGAITYNFIECLQAQFWYEGQSDGFYDQWQLSQNGEILLDYETIDGSGTTINFPEAGLYTIGVTDALNCDGEIEAIFIDVLVEPCPSCPEIFTEYLTCEEGGFFYEGDISGTSYCWELWFEGSMLTTYYDESYTEIAFPGPGQYSVGITNALDCNGLPQSYFITVNVEDCDPQNCPEIYTEFLECLEGGFYYIGDISGGSYCWELWSDGNMLTTYFDDSFTQISFPGPGEYQVGITNALNCNGEQESFFITVFVEDCNGNSCGCEQTNNLLANGNFEAGTNVSSGLGISCQCEPATVCVGSEPQDKCENVLWLDNFYDHTYSTPNGNFLIVDGGPGNVWNEEVQVVEGETYNFSMWIAREISDNNSGNNSTQSLYTEINGVVHSAFSTADAQPQTWTEYCFEYTAEYSGAATIGLGQESGTGYNDWGLDDVYFGTCGDSEECPEIIVEALECDYGLFSYAGEIDNSTWSSICWEVYDSNNNLLSTYLDGELTDYNFLEPGTYYISVTNAVPCNDEIPVIEIEVPECGGNCPEITVNPAECLYGSYTYTGEHTSDMVQWQIIQNEEVLLEIWGSESVNISYIEEGFYTIAVANALSCDGAETAYAIDVWVEDCNQDCAFDLEYSVNCEEFIVYMPDFVTEYYIDFGNGVYGEFMDANLYDEPGWYQVCYEAYIGECEQWVGDCFEIYIEDCDETCELELSYYTDCNEFTMVMPDVVTDYYIDYGNGIYGEIQETVLYDEPGVYTVCYEAYMEECDEWVADCLEIFIEDCETECLPMTLSLDADYGEIDNVTELISAAIIGEEGEAVWEGLLPLSTFITSIDVELCIPPGCYTFQIMNEDPLLLASLSLGLESLETDDVQIDSNLDIFSGNLEALISVDSDCTVGVEEIVAAELTAYPVPSATNVNVTFSSEGWNYKVLDMTGRTVHEQNAVSVSEVINVTNWANGIYIIRAQKDDKMLTKKIEVSH